MSKKITIVFLALALCLTSCLPLSLAYADEADRSKIQSIISGQQDLLVFAAINEKGTSSYEVEIIYEIGAQVSVEQGEDSESLKKTDTQNDIYVKGLNSYVYYDNYTYQPKKGDNVLLSLTNNGNEYYVKNGAFKVDHADIDNFNFVVPEGVGSDIIAELAALYVYVASDGKRSDVFIEDNKVYALDADGRQTEISGPFGLKFIDEFGDTTDNSTAGYSPSIDTAEQDPYRWIKASLIIFFGIVIGGVVIYMLSKFEKRHS